MCKTPLTWFPLLKNGYLRVSFDHQWRPFDSPPIQYLCCTQSSHFSSEISLLTRLKSSLFLLQFAYLIVP